MTGEKTLYGNLKHGDYFRFKGEELIYVKINQDVFEGDYCTESHVLETKEPDTSAVLKLCLNINDIMESLQS